VYQISSKSDDFSLRYGDLTIFKMAAVRHLGFKKIAVFVIQPLSAYCSASSYKILLKSNNRSMSYSQKRDFQDGARCHLEFLTTGQSNLTKSTSRGAHSPVRGHPRGSKVVPLNSWGRVSYQCAIVTPKIQSYTEILIDNLTWLILILSQHLIQLTG